MTRRADKHEAPPSFRDSPLAEDGTPRPRSPLSSKNIAPDPAVQTSSESYRTRIAAVRAKLRDCDSALITNLNNIRYLTGFTGSAALFVIAPDSEHIIVDFRYTEQAAAECWCEVTKREGPLERSIHNYLRGGRRCAFESGHMTVDTFDRLRQTCTASAISGTRPTISHPPPSGGTGTERIAVNEPPQLDWIPTPNLVESVRLIKDEEEIARLKASAALLEELMARTIEQVRADVTELDVAVQFESAARKATGRPLPFEPIIASGPRAALPHGVSSKRTIRKGDFVVIDIGVNLDGYVADMTRTVAVGSADERMKEVHAAVHLANRTAARAVTCGMTGGEAHAVAVGVLEAAGLAVHFGHGLGHGIGVEIHELPRLAHEMKDVLTSGMVFTIEPGVYIPEWGGVRVEDSGVLRSNGMEIFNRMERQLIVV